MSIIFPKPLPALTKKSETDKTGFTELEKVTLRNLWRVIKRHKRKHSRNVFQDMYTENDQFLEYFRNSKGRISMNALHFHSRAILVVYERLIEDGLDNEGLFHVILSEVFSKHLNVLSSKDAKDAIEKQTDLSIAYCERVLAHSGSPTLTVALTKLSNLIRSYLISD